MVKPKKIKNLVEAPTKFYAHYDSVTNEIVSVNNFRNLEYSNAVEISFDTYERLLTGKDRFEDFYAGVVVQNGNPVMGLVYRRILLEHNFNNRLLSWIDDKTEFPEIEIHWDGFNKKWIFVASDEFRQKYYDNKVQSLELSFFITLGRDPNFLIRSIDFDLKKLIMDKAIIDFATKWETNINSISITSNLASLNYSLNVWKTDDQDY
jgi:hypothetical protein